MNNKFNQWTTFLSQKDRPRRHANSPTVQDALQVILCLISCTRVMVTAVMYKMQSGGWPYPHDRQLSMLHVKSLKQMLPLLPQLHPGYDTIVKREHQELKNDKSILYWMHFDYTSIVHNYVLQFLAFAISVTKLVKVLLHTQFGATYTCSWCFVQGLGLSL